jgi:hypothetical protein
VTRLFDRGKDAGAIRADAAPEDAAVMFAMLGGTFAGTDHWRRHLALLLDGLRSTNRPELPGAAPSFATLDDVIDVSKAR